MKTSHVLSACLLSSVISAAPLRSYHFAKRSSSFNKTVSEKVILDNDGMAPLYVLFPLLGGLDVVGVTGAIGDYTVEDAVYYNYESLAPAGLDSCIPQYVGASESFVRTNETFHIWEDLYGELVWQGKFTDGYERTVPAGFKNFTDVVYNDTQSAAEFIISQVKTYPGQVTIIAAGALTNLAQAIIQYPELPTKAKKLVIMGGYVDNQIAQVTGGDFTNDMYTDINLMTDPEAAQKTLSAGWSELVICGNITSQIFPTQNFYNTLVNATGGNITSIEKADKYSYIESYVGNGTLVSGTFPFWDEIASAVATWPEIVTSSYEAYVSVDTSFNSPFYGSLRMLPANLNPPKGYKTGKATMVTGIDLDTFYSKAADALLTDFSTYCTTNTTTYLTSNNTLANLTVSY